MDQKQTGQVLFAFPESIWGDLERVYNRDPEKSASGVELEFSKDNLVDALTRFIMGKLGKLNEDIQALYLYKKTTKSRGYSRSKIYSIDKPDRHKREFIDLISLYAFQLTYPESVHANLMPDNLDAYFAQSSLLTSKDAPGRRIVESVEAQDSNEMLMDIVRAANSTEFQAYKKVPLIETDSLLKYLTEAGTAYLRIVDILKLHTAKGWVLTNPGNSSGYRIDSIWVERVTAIDAIVRTKEYWYLKWYSMRSKRYVHIYNELNEQTWYLVRQEGKWLVDATYYPPPKKRWINTVYKLWSRLVSRISKLG